MRDSLLLLALGLLALPVAGCPSADDDDSSPDEILDDDDDDDDDDSSPDDDDSSPDDDDSSPDDDDSAGDDDDSAGDDDDSAGVTLASLTVLADQASADTRGTITLTITALWSDSTSSTVTEGDGLTLALTNVTGADTAEWNEPAVTSIRATTCTAVASLDGIDSAAVSLEFVASVVAPGDFIVHELLADGTAGDANGDGGTNADQDAFVEFLNVAGVELDLAGCMVTERDFDPNLPRHTFDVGDVVLPGQTVVVFGGGSVDIAPAGATVVIADNASDPGTPLFLHLDPAGDIIRLRDALGVLVTELAYGSEGTAGVPDANLDESITRDPQITGTTWAAHTVVAASASVFSPGTQANGSVFP